MAGRNIGYNSELHDIFTRELRMARSGLEIIQTSFLELYPNSQYGPEARVRREMATALRSLDGIGLAIAQIRQKEGER